MTNNKAVRLFRKRSTRSYVGRGETYSWLRAYHRQVTAALEREEVTWARLVAEMTLDGVVGQAGAPLTANAALRVWQRVCRDVAAAAAYAAKRQNYPSRMPSNLRPDTAMPQPAAIPPASAPPLPGQA